MYTIKEAAHRTGVSVPLLRAWQRRYGLVSPERTEAGYRLYSADDLARIRAMRQLIDAGWSASAAAASLAGQPMDVIRGRNEQMQDPASLVDQFVTATAAMDSVRTETILDTMGSLGSFEFVAETYLLPALVAVGAAWERGTLDVAAEHAASHAVLRRLASAFEAAGRARTDDRPVLVGLPPGARHELGALAFSVAARRAGLTITYLGADLPTRDWVDAVKHSGAQAAVIAVPTERDRDAASAVAASLRVAVPALLIAAGGRGAEDGTLPAEVLTLPAGLPQAASVLSEAIAR